MSKRKEGLLKRTTETISDIFGLKKSFIVRYMRHRIEDILVNNPIVHALKQRRLLDRYQYGKSKNHKEIQEIITCDLLHALGDIALIDEGSIDRSELKPIFHKHLKFFPGAKDFFEKIDRFGDTIDCKQLIAQFYASYENYMMHVLNAHNDPVVKDMMKRELLVSAFLMEIPESERFAKKTINVLSENTGKIIHTGLQKVIAKHKVTPMSMPSSQFNFNKNKEGNTNFKLRELLYLWDGNLDHLIDGYGNEFYKHEVSKDSLDVSISGFKYLENLVNMAIQYIWLENKYPIENLHLQEWYPYQINEHDDLRILLQEGWHFGSGNYGEVPEDIKNDFTMLQSTFRGIANYLRGYFQDQTSVLGFNPSTDNYEQYILENGIHKQLHQNWLDYECSKIIDNIQDPKLQQKAKTEYLEKNKGYGRIKLRDGVYIENRGKLPSRAINKLLIDSRYTVAEHIKDNEGCRISFRPHDSEEENLKQALDIFYKDCWIGLGKDALKYPEIKGQYLQLLSDNGVQLYLRSDAARDQEFIKFVKDVVNKYKKEGLSNSKTGELYSEIKFRSPHAEYQIKRDGLDDFGTNNYLFYQIKKDIRKHTLFKKGITIMGPDPYTYGDISRLLQEQMKDYLSGAFQKLKNHNGNFVKEEKKAKKAIQIRLIHQIIWENRKKKNYVKHISRFLGDEYQLEKYTLTQLVDKNNQLLQQILKCVDTIDQNAIDDFFDRYMMETVGNKMAFLHTDNGKDKYIFPEMGRNYADMQFDVMEILGLQDYANRKARDLKLRF